MLSLLTPTNHKMSLVTGMKRSWESTDFFGEKIGHQAKEKTLQPKHEDRKKNNQSIIDLLHKFHRANMSCPLFALNHLPKGNGQVITVYIYIFTVYKDIKIQIVQLIEGRFRLVFFLLTSLLFFAFQPKAHVQPLLPDLQVPLLLLRMPRSLRIHGAPAEGKAWLKSGVGGFGAYRKISELSNCWKLEVIFELLKRSNTFLFFIPFFFPHHPLPKKRDRKYRAFFHFLPTSFHFNIFKIPYLLLW